MANLLGTPASKGRFEPLDASALERVAARAPAIAAWVPETGSDARLAEALAVELDELEASPDVAAVQALLARIDAHRVEGVAAGDPLAWLVHFPGRSLETGEAEVASRGFVDARDRPPLGLWCEAIARRAAAPARGVEVAVLCGVPPVAREAARAARAGCRSGALVWLEEVSEPLLVQLAGRVETARVLADAPPGVR